MTMTAEQEARWRVSLVTAGLSAEEIERILARPYQDVNGVACFEPEDKAA